MISLFAICAVIGGTVLLCQTALTVLGLGHDLDVDDPFDPFESPPDASAHSDGHASSTLFGMLTFRTVIAAMTFFGLAGLAADAGGLPTIQVLAIAVVSGMSAIYGVHHLMQMFASLRSDGTVRLQDAIGEEGQVYLRIPAHHGGRGKIHVVLNQQTVELQAETSGELIPSGQVVRVVEFLGGDIVSVIPMSFAERSPDREFTDQSA